MTDVYYFAISFAYLVTSPAAIILCFGLSVMMGNYKAAIPIAAALQYSVSLGIESPPSDAVIVAAALSSGAMLGILGVFIRRRVLSSLGRKTKLIEGEYLPLDRDD